MPDQPHVIRKVPQPTTVVPGSKDDPPHGWIRIICDKPALNIMHRMGPDPPNITGGFGGYDIVERPRQVSMTIWKGIEPFQLTFSLMMDVFHEVRTTDAYRSVEDDIESLIRCARGAKDSEPGTVEVLGIPRLPAESWVFENVEFDSDGVIRDGRNFSRLRQKVTITLREEVDPEYSPIRKHARDKAKGPTMMVKAKDGDTPITVARRYKLSSWFILRRLNKNLVFKSNQKFKKGQRLRVPIQKSKSNSKHNTKK
jgi:hypothetical protein